MVALVGAVVPDPSALGLQPAVLAFACMLGWGLGVTMTPMSSSAIITARWAEVSPWTVTYQMERTVCRVSLVARLGRHRYGLRVVAALTSMRPLGDEPCQPREFRRPLRMVERAGQPDRNVGHRSRRAGT